MSNIFVRKFESSSKTSACNGNFSSRGSTQTSDKELRKIVEALMNRAGELGFRATDFYAALMDFGSLVCTKNAPKWELLSSGMKSVCMAYGKHIVRTKNVYNKEQGREVAGKHIPNRIFRGRVVEALRDHAKGLSFDVIGRTIAADWTMGDHKAWLDVILRGLERDAIVTKKGKSYVLQS